MQARGFWADAIQLKPADEITFAPMEGAQMQKGVTADAAPETDELL